MAKRLEAERTFLSKLNLILKWQIGIYFTRLLAFAGKSADMNQHIVRSNTIRVTRHCGLW